MSRIHSNHNVSMQRGLKVAISVHGLPMMNVVSMQRGLKACLEPILQSQFLVEVSMQRGLKA